MTGPKEFPWSSTRTEAEGNRHLWVPVALSSFIQSTAKEAFAAVKTISQEITAFIKQINVIDETQ